ncbi:arginine decarboxylase [Pontibacter sp. G13]|uniref:arginine decarboxylase n=1 Tax=Pontibacter sp. G13 TaxID=3074898 RepID=UPI00288B5E37|nr:arginine decarboxylase [Pontibacter sp. G13]WNJ16364.1 arginine decarboxylase [Pontibacter sp. G13]
MRITSMQSYLDFLNQSYFFPPEGFQVLEDELYFHGVNLMELIETYKTPLRFTYLPVIGNRINDARSYFDQAIKEVGYEGEYTYCYCTKSSHFKHIMVEVLKHKVQLETSSAFDMPMIRSLYRGGHLQKDILVVCNGFKDLEYKQHIVDMIHDGFTNIIPVLDNREELNFYDSELEDPCQLGMRLATEEPPDSSFYTSRLGIRADDILDLYNKKIKDHPNFKVVLLHFFVHTGIRDTPFFWSELRKFVNLYCQFRKINPNLTKLDIGGGMPFRDSLDFEFDYQYVVTEIVKTIQEICLENDVPTPDILTEFGSYTVAESSCTLFKVLGKKMQNDREKWLMIDGSIISMLPDVWALNRRFMLLPINNWEMEYERVYIGGMTCDSDDYYNHEAHVDAIYLPKTRRQQFIGFFHTGAYQEVLSGVGGLHHCLMPDPKHVLLDESPDGSRHVRVLHEEQNSKQVMKILGYKN